MKTVTIKTLYAQILESVNHDTLVNGYFGGSNILAEELNDYSSQGLNYYVADFLQDHAHKLDRTDIESILENPDYILQMAAATFVDGIASALNENGKGQEWAENILRHGHHWFDSWGDYFIYCDQWANEGQSLFLIRASNENEAYEELLTRFEKHFASGDEVDNSENTEQELNDNGVPVNTDYLTCLAHVKFVKE